MLEAPEFGGFSSIVSGNAGVLLVTVMVRWAPGFTCRVGFCNPSGVMKQNSSRLYASILCWYENLALSTPLELNRAGGFFTTSPAAKRRGQGSATSGTGGGAL